MTNKAVGTEASQPSIYYLSPIHCIRPTRPAPRLKTCVYLTWTLFQPPPPPPPLVASGLFNSCHFCTLVPYCRATNPSAQPRQQASHPPSFSPPSPPLPSSQPLCQWHCKSPEAGSAKRSSCLNRSAVGVWCQPGRGSCATVVPYIGGVC